MASGHISLGPATANDRFKRGYPRSTYMGITAAVAIHFVLFQFSPKLNAADICDDCVGGPLIPIVPPPETVVLPAIIAKAPPKVDLPGPRGPIVRPKTPLVADVILDRPFHHLKMPEPVWEDPPPPQYVERDDEPIFQNWREIQQLLMRHYPSMLREAGIGGTVLLWVFVDEEGVPAKYQVMKSSGYPAMDEAAAQAVSKMEFTPALNRERPVGVWIQQAVTFRVD